MTSMLCRDFIILVIKTSGMKIKFGWGSLAIVGIGIPMTGFGQTTTGGGLASGIHGLQGTLDQVFQTMLGLSGSLTGVGRAWLLLVRFGISLLRCGRVC